VQVRRRLALIALAVAGVAGSSLAVAGPAQAAGKFTGTGTARTGGIALNMRKMPSSSAERLGTVANGKTVWIMCRTAGDRVTGTVRTTNVWLRLANNTYVSDAYVQHGSIAIPLCATASTPAPASAGGWQLPVGAGLVSGFRTLARPSHDGVDLAAPRNTPILAAAAGTVIRVVCNVSAGSCDTDGNPTLSGCGWYVEVLHAGDVVTRYCHLVRRPSVAIGQRVAKGQVLGHVGTSGSSSGPHLHFEVHQGMPASKANAVDPLTFLRARGLVLR
jgi:murein DD-endopeptidase MepM/ murein hydrolase activator NlpD